MRARCLLRSPCIRVPLDFEEGLTLWLPRPNDVSNPRKSVTLAAGGPLNNTVTANRQGRDLRLDYKLLGAGGQAYSLVRHGPAVQPEFAVYKGDKKIASGKFEFG